MLAVFHIILFLICFCQSEKTSTKINTLKKFFSAYKGYYRNEYFAFSNPTPCNTSWYIMKNVKFIIFDKNELILKLKYK